MSKFNRTVNIFFIIISSLSLLFFILDILAIFRFSVYLFYISLGIYFILFIINFREYFEILKFKDADGSEHILFLFENLHKVITLLIGLGLSFMLLFSFYFKSTSLFGYIRGQVEKELAIEFVGAIVLGRVESDNGGCLKFSVYSENGNYVVNGCANEKDDTFHLLELKLIKK